MSKKQITIYTDGACKGNPGPGGWGAVLSYNHHTKKLYGSQTKTTNNQMELMAVIEALKVLKSSCDITLYTDSKYVLTGATDWLPRWKKNNWKTSTKKPIKNRELWEILDTLLIQHTIRWKWVKGHTGNTGNELADQLACKGAEEAQKQAE